MRFMLENSTTGVENTGVQVGPNKINTATREWMERTGWRASPLKWSTRLMTEINHYTAESSELGDAGYEGCPWSVESLKDEGAEMSVRVAPTRLQSMIISLHFPTILSISYIKSFKHLEIDLCYRKWNWTSAFSSLLLFCLCSRISVVQHQPDTSLLSVYQTERDEKGKNKGIY